MKYDSGIRKDGRETTKYKDKEKVVQLS